MSKKAKDIVITIVGFILITFAIILNQQEMGEYLDGLTRLISGN